MSRKVEDYENKINRQTKNEEIDRLLEEHVYAEIKILESAILKAAENPPREEFRKNLKRNTAGYDRLIARLKEKGVNTESHCLKIMITM